MTPYVIVTEENKFDLADKVNDLIEQGYSPVGSPYYNSDGSISQAVFQPPVKEEDTSYWVQTGSIT